MNDYLKLFQTHQEYEDFVSGGTMVKPNVSHCVQENEVHYNPHTFADEYFTTVALESGTISFNIWQSMGTEYITSISYSTDNGETWTTTNNTNNKSENLVITVNVNEDDKVMWKGDATQLGYFDEDNYGDVVGSFFSSTCEFDAQGNIMSLLYGDDFKGETTIENNYAFTYLFHNYDDNNETCKVVNVKNLSLPATTLAHYCYSHMFQKCTSLTTVPKLPATTLVRGCYYNMFYSCTSLTTVPNLPATTLANSCYQYMFNGCTSLTVTPELPATTLADSCYDSMFQGTNVLPDTSNIDFTSEQVVASGGLSGLFAGTKVTDNDLMRILPKNDNGKYCLPVTTLANSCYQDMFRNCTSLTVAPELPATTLANRCYCDMFRGCTSLTVTPELPATTLAEYCYSGMFTNCTNLTTAPELSATTLAEHCYHYMFSSCASLITAPSILPATTLASSCYESMFNGCASLTVAPVLPATTLANFCYYYMFYGCTSLNYIKAMFTTTPSGSSPNYYTGNWVRNVAASGTFVKNSAATWTTTGVHGIPTGWTVQTASA